MRGLLRGMIRWALNDAHNGKVYPAIADAQRSDAAPSCRINILRAMNGRILEVSTYKPNPHGPDWTSELFIVPEDQTLQQALTTLLTLKGQIE